MGSDNDTCVPEHLDLLANALLIPGKNIKSELPENINQIELVIQRAIVVTGPQYVDEAVGLHGIIDRLPEALETTKDSTGDEKWGLTVQELAVFNGWEPVQYLRCQNDTRR